MTRILTNKKALMVIVLGVMIFQMVVFKTLAYFTAYCDAWGSKTLSLSKTTELHEKIHENDKEIAITNTSEATDVYTRVKVIFDDNDNLDVSVVDLGSNYWKYNESDDYWYYTKPLAPGSTSDILKAEVTTKIEDSNISIIVVHEHVIAIYNDDGTGNMEQSWEYGMEVINDD